MKKLLSLLMLLCLTLTVAPAALAEEVVNVYNWEDYIAPEVLTLFTEETGIKVNYMCFTTNEDMIVQVEANPGAFDVCFPSDYIIERMIAKDLLAEINYDNVPNFEQIIDKLRNPDYDPENKYSVPYMWGNSRHPVQQGHDSRTQPVLEHPLGHAVPEERVHAGLLPRQHGHHAEVPRLFHEQPRSSGADGSEG